LNPSPAATIVDSLKGLFVPEEAIGEQYRKGLDGPRFRGHELENGPERCEAKRSALTRHCCTIQ
jgi:hypothetical protein